MKSETGNIREGKALVPVTAARIKFNNNRSVTTTSVSVGNVCFSWLESLTRVRVRKFSMAEGGKAERIISGPTVFVLFSTSLARSYSSGLD